MLHHFDVVLTHRLWKMSLHTMHGDEWPSLPYFANDDIGVGFALTLRGNSLGASHSPLSEPREGGRSGVVHIPQNSADTNRNFPRGEKKSFIVFGPEKMGL